MLGGAEDVENEIPGRGQRMLVRPARLSGGAWSSLAPVLMGKCINLPQSEQWAN